MIQKAMTDHKYLTRAYISGVVAAILMRFAASAAKPGIFHLILALIAVCAIVGAYLSIARSNVDGGLKAANIVGAAVVSGACFALLSLVL